MRSTKQTLLLLLFWALAASGCAEETDPRSIPGGNADSASESESGSVDDGQSTDTSPDTANPGGTVCDEQPLSVARQGGRVMILQDLSYSMSLAVPAGTDAVKWDSAKAALSGVVTDPAFTSIEFGFDSFPDSGACGTGVLQHDCSEDGGQTIANLLEGIEIAYEANTPLYCAIARYLDPGYAPSLSSQDKPRYLLIVSDGQPTCSTDCENPDDGGASPPPSELGKLTAQLAQKGIKTFIIGFQYTGADDPAYLEAIAENGGTDFGVIRADDQKQLEEALLTLTGTVLTCNFAIDEPAAAADPNLVNFYFDGDEDPIPLDAGCKKGVGWTWTDEEHTQIELCKDACDTLMAGEVEKVIAKFGCQTVVV